MVKIGKHSSTGVSSLSPLPMINGSMLAGNFDHGFPMFSLV